MEADRLYGGEDLDVVAISREVRGVVQRYEYAHRPQIAIAVAIEGSGRIVLIRQHRAGIGTETLELPAGKIGDEVQGETPMAAMARELREEAGFAATELQARGVLHTAPHFSDEVCHVFLAHGEIVSEPSPGPREELALELVEPAGLLHLIGGGELVDAKSIAAVFLCEEFGQMRGPS